MEMGDRIRSQRKLVGLTQDELAEKLGLKKSAIAKYENGRVENIKRSVIQEMARILECTPSYLMGFDDAVKKQTLRSDEEQLIEKYEQLNVAGKHKLHERADELIHLGYTDELLAAHDEGATEDQKAAALKIMEDDSEWK